MIPFRKLLGILPFLIATQNNCVISELSAPDMETFPDTEIKDMSNKADAEMPIPEPLCGDNDHEGFCQFDCVSIIPNETPGKPDIRSKSPDYCLIEPRRSSLLIKATVGRIFYSQPTAIARACLCSIPLGANISGIPNDGKPRVSISYSYQLDYQYKLASDKVRIYQNIDQMIIFTRENPQVDFQKIIFQYLSSASAGGYGNLSRNDAILDTSPQSRLYIMLLPDYINTLATNECQFNPECTPREASLRIDNLVIRDKGIDFGSKQN